MLCADNIRKQATQTSLNPLSVITRCTLWRRFSSHSTGFQVAHKAAGPGYSPDKSRPIKCFEKQEMTRFIKHPQRRSHIQILKCAWGKKKSATCKLLFITADSRESPNLEPDVCHSMDFVGFATINIEHYNLFSFSKQIEEEKWAWSPGTISLLCFRRTVKQMCHIQKL